MCASHDGTPGKHKRCQPHWDGNPRHDGGELLTPQRNPTCNTIQYAGGLSCCGHKRVLLDEDQDPGPSLLRYHMKFRFWFQEYTPGSAPADAPPRMYRAGALPAGSDAMPPANMSVARAVSACAKASTCTGITFEAADRHAAGGDVRVYFKNGTSLTNGAVGWHTFVVDEIRRRRTFVDNKRSSSTNVHQRQTFVID